MPLRALLSNLSTPARVLVVDDQASNVQLVGSILGKLGFEIVPASDGPTALKRLALRVPDLILLDVLMPEMDGTKSAGAFAKIRSGRAFLLFFSQRPTTRI
jgi:CheY-like chemotaxis protein